MTRQKLDAEVSIGRRHHGSRDDTIVIEIVDTLSHCRIVEVELGLEEFANAITNLSGRPAKALWNVSKLGMKREHKQEVLRFEDLDKYEVHGWRAHKGDFKNHHRSRDGENYLVSFERYLSTEYET